jgi:hypothetical protein
MARSISWVEAACWAISTLLQRNSFLAPRPVTICTRIDMPMGVASRSSTAASSRL